MTFSPAADAIGPGRTAIDVIDDDGQHVATIYAMSGGLNIVTTPNYEPADLAVEVQPPMGVQFAIRARGDLGNRRRVAC
jgi:hypothetical protein